jgi:hypothetical protein
MSAPVARDELPGYIPLTVAKHASQFKLRPLQALGWAAAFALILALIGAWYLYGDAVRPVLVDASRGAERLWLS